MYRKNAARVLSCLVVAGMLYGGAGCGKDASEDKDIKNAAADIVNGSFEAEHESGQWVGWTRSGSSFNVRGLSDVTEMNGVEMEKDGTFFFCGTAADNPAMKGTLTSDVFTLGGNGFITFKMGGGKNTEKMYVEFFEEGNDAAIAKVANTDCDGIFITDHLITKVVNLSDYVGKNIYIKITDNDDGLSLIHI